jgi:hypothetical protein
VVSDCSSVRVEPFGRENKADSPENESLLTANVREGAAIAM